MKWMNSDLEREVSERQGELENHLVLFSGKPIEKMNYEELKREIRIQKWFANRMNRLAHQIDWGLSQRRKELEADTKVQEAEEKFEKGEIDEKKLNDVKARNKLRHTKLRYAEEKLEYLYICQYNAKAIEDACQDRLNYVEKKSKRRRKVPRYYKSHWTNQVGAKMKTRKDRIRSINNHLSLSRWQNTIERMSLGALWDLDRFRLICKDRGYSNEVSMHYFVAERLNLTQSQVRVLLKVGKFTWGQVLVLGAELEMTPREFCDTFMSGYFIEQSEDIFVASLQNCPSFEAEE